MTSISIRSSRNHICPRTAYRSSSLLSRFPNQPFVAPSMPSIDLSSWSNRRCCYAPNSRGASDFNKPMKECRQFYINGEWVSPSKTNDFAVVNPANEEAIAVISLGGAVDVDRAVAAAKAAFESYSETTVSDRLALLARVIEIYKSRMDEMAEAISMEMGAPISLSRAAQAPAGLAHLLEIVKVLEHFKFEERKGSTLMRKEPIGVCGLITPWNWPMNQVVCKVAPALAAGCTMVLKPSELAPLSAYLFAQILHDAGGPVGVFNLVNGD